MQEHITLFCMFVRILHSKKDNVTMSSALIEGTRVLYARLLYANDWQGDRCWFHT